MKGSELSANIMHAANDVEVPPGHTGDTHVCTQSNANPSLETKDSRAEVCCVLNYQNKLDMLYART